MDSINSVRAELVEAHSFFFTGSMPFWAYLIQCADRRFYAGHTDDLERRISEHQSGTIPGYTRTRLPVHLVWSEEFPSRYEALQAERQIKGWSKAKKLALIRGDWALISALARPAKEEGRASTGSVQPAPMWSHDLLFLHPHPGLLPSEPFNFQATVRLAAKRLRVQYRLTGDLQPIAIPRPAVPARRDGLWQHTCFEAFLQTERGYLEFNFSPSTEWAGYCFSSYREGMAEIDMQPPKIRLSQDEHALELTADLVLPPGVAPLRLGLSAVIEEVSGAKSYWALRHPPGDRPDFHHPDCFAIELPPASEP